MINHDDNMMPRLNNNNNKAIQETTAVSLLQYYSFNLEHKQYKSDNSVVLVFSTLM